MIKRRRLLGFGLLLALCAAAIVLRVTDARRALSAPGHTFDSNGVTIWYEVRGEVRAAPLVVINGGPGFDHTYLNASDVWEKLAVRRPVVFYDQRGTGRSETWKPGDPHSLVDYLADLEALRSTLGVETIDLIGHSWGGYLSMAYTIRYPEHVQGLILCDSVAPRFADTLFLFKALFPDIMERQERLTVLQSLGDDGAGKEGIRALLGTLFVSQEKRDAFLARADSLHFNYELNQAVEASVANQDLGPALEGIKARTLILNGRFDANVGPETAWKLHRSIQGSRIEFFEKSGHFPFIEEPEKFLETVESFLDGR